jgi:phosphoglycolate phosphatase-like HAD superfamily hydrolase
VDTVVIGDTPADVDAAQRNGCRVVAVATGRSPADVLREAGAETVLPDLSDLRAVLEAIFGCNTVGLPY